MHTLSLSLCSGMCDFFYKRLYGFMLGCNADQWCADALPMATIEAHIEFIDEFMLQIVLPSVSGNSFSRFVTLSHTLPLFLALPHSFSHSTTLSRTLPLFLALPHSFSHSVTLPHTLPLFLTLCHPPSHSVTLPRTLPLFLTLCHSPRALSCR
jgi:hypothetical protein